MEFQCSKTLYEVVFFTTCIICCLNVVRLFWIYLFTSITFGIFLKLFTRWKHSCHMEPKSKAVLITGCDTGFGHHLAKRLDDHGFEVFAGVLCDKGSGAEDLRRRNSKRLHVIKLDVTNDHETNAAVEFITHKCKTKGLWGLVNNAGFNIHGDVEFMSVEQYKKVNEVNIYGLIRVTKASLPLIRKAKGRIVNISSARGRHSRPYDSVYHVSKHGLETLTDSLRLEMRKFGVKVCVVEPGGFDGATSCSSPKQLERITQELEIAWSLASREVKEAYGRGHIDRIIEGLNKPFPPTSPDSVLRAIEDALLSISPRPRVLVFGRSPGSFIDKSAMLAVAFNYLPTSIYDYVTSRMTGCDKVFVTGNAKKD